MLICHTNKTECYYFGVPLEKNEVEGIEDLCATRYGPETECQVINITGELKITIKLSGILVFDFTMKLLHLIRFKVKPNNSFGPMTHTYKNIEGIYEALRKMEFILRTTQLKPFHQIRNTQIEPNMPIANPDEFHEN